MSTSIKVIQRPHKFCFSKNPVQYKFLVPSWLEAGLFIEIEVFVRNIGDGFFLTDLVYTESIKPNSDTTTYNVQDIAEAMIGYDIPDFSGSVVQRAGTVKELFIKYRIVTDAYPIGFWYSEESSFRYVIKGGIANPSADWNNYFINYVNANKPFLTWQPPNRFIGLNDEFFISWLNIDAVVTLSLLALVTFTDGTTATVAASFGDFGEHRLYHIKAGPDQLGLNAIDITKQLYKYSLQIVQTADHTNVFANGYTYYIDYRKFYYTKYFHYFNSLGGLESVRIRGEIEFDVNITFTEAEKFAGDIIIGDPNAEEYTQTSKLKFDSYKGEVGYLHTKTEQDILQELLITRFAWERLGNKNIRIYVTNGVTKMRTTSDKTYSLPITWRYSFNNSVFTPVDIDLGTGNDIEEYVDPADVCPVPAGLLVTQFTIESTGQVVNTFLWTSLFPVTLQVKRSVIWVDLAIGVYTGFTFIYHVGDGTFSWRAKTICDPYATFESGYVNGPDFTC